MPATTHGTPIPTNANIGNSLEALLKAPRLDIQRSPQEQDAWCYAACAQMVINAVITNGFVEQCDVAGFVKNISCCPPTPDKCRKSGCNFKQVGEIFKNFHINYEGSGPPEVEIRQDTIFEIRSEISDGRPIEVVITWNTDGADNSSHAVLITGVTDDDYVFITDPLRGVNYGGWQHFEFLRHGFHEGQWVRTWKGLRKTQEVT